MKYSRRKFGPFAIAAPVIGALLIGGVLTEHEPPVQAAAKKPVPIAGVPDDIANKLNTYCIECHGPDAQKGKVRFDTLDQLTPEGRVDFLTRANESVHFEEMPPSTRDQPSDEDRESLLAWFSTQLDGSVDKKLQEKMRYPHYGNIVDHELLFSGEITDKPFTPSRRWLVSPQIFKERVMDVFQLEGRERENYQSREFYGVTNPFVLPADSGVKDYDIGMLTGGHLLVMLNNAQWIAEKQVFATKLHGTRHKDVRFENPKDKWYPRNFGPEAFKAVLNAEGAPTDEQLAAAIQQQFDLVLNRKPTDEELAKYLGLMKQMVGKVDNETALTQMCMAVLLEADFLYRVQFGGGEEDAHGRKQLTPREAAFAISYALGDRKPDAELMKAAEEGRLQTKADYKREVARLLADESYYRGPVDPSISGGHYQSNVVSHPKTIRFFRDFFGYRAAAGVFKDPPRAEARYQNPGRGTAGTPGALIREADLIVTYHVENDEDVFENLLTSDKYFVYDQLMGDKGKAIIDEWKLVWETLKDTPWQAEPQRVLEENFDFIKEQKTLRITKIDDRRAVGNFVSHMRFFMDYFPKGKTPYPRGPWTHGYYINHSFFYSLPRTPMRGWYMNRPTDPEHWAKQQAKNIEWWDYPLEQPFSIPNRKGILSHPAWLIAHSLNFHTDPIKRGRWIQEKLLAGRVPDVPITVDALVPEDPHRTFRERVEDVTSHDDCWKCHKYMNPLGLPFEAFDDFGRFRTEELMEHPENLIKRGNGKTTFDEYPTKPIDTTGHLKGTYDSSIDGPVEDPFELIDKLAKSDRVRQSIIRHAFRFYMGRNEMLSDSQTLIDADRAYVESGGSFDAVILSLLTSDSFMYRKDAE
jgi:mono/diheme cytochrome c family protein